MQHAWSFSSPPTDYKNSTEIIMEWKREMKYFLENSCKSAILSSVQNAFRMQNFFFIMEFYTFAIDKD